MKDNFNTKDEIVKRMTDIELYPTVVESDFEVSKYTKLSMTDVTSLGTALEPLAIAFSSVVNGSGVYKVTIPNGMHLANLKSGAGNIGTLLNAKNQIAGQAVINPVAFDPTMAFVAVALANINMKLDSILEVQEEMLDFIVQKEKSELKGDLIFLTDVLNNYKYNWNNEKYKNGNHLKVLDIKQSSERKIDFYREMIIKATSKKSLIRTDQDNKKQIDKIQDDFGNYQLAIYLYSFSSFLEVMLLENFDSKFLYGVTNKIENYSIKYRELYTKCYTQLEINSQNSVESFLLKGLANVNKATGQAISKIPVINKYQADETLIELSDKIMNFDKERIEKSLQNILDKQVSNVRPFIENIKTVSKLYNEPLVLVFDHENIYLSLS